MTKERLEELLISAFEHAIEVSEDNIRDLIKATKITSEELDDIGYDKNNFPEMHSWIENN